MGYGKVCRSMLAQKKSVCVLCHISYHLHSAVPGFQLMSRPSRINTSRVINPRLPDPANWPMHYIISPRFKSFEHDICHLKLDLEKMSQGNLSFVLHKPREVSIEDRPVPSLPTPNYVKVHVQATGYLPRNFDCSF
jgi:hypothetical protein